MSQLTFEKMRRCCIKRKKKRGCTPSTTSPAPLPLFSLVLKQHFKRRNVSDQLGPVSLQKLALSLNVILVHVSTAAIKKPHYCERMAKCTEKKFRGIV